MNPNIYFSLVVVGLPLVMLVVALLAGRFYREGYERLLDWKPTRSPAREVELELDDTHQMLGALNRYRRARGAPERSLEEMAEHTWASLDRFDAE